MELSLISIFGAGMLTLLTPCILPILPVWLSLLMGAGVDAGRAGSSRNRLVLSSLLFVAGFSLVFTLLGLGASSVGSVLQEYRSWMLLGGGVVIAFFGLKYLGLIKLTFLEKTLQVDAIKTGSKALDALLFGVLFALGWTPCVGPILGSVLTYTTATTTSAWMGALYLLAYSLGVGVPFLVVSLLADRLVPKLRKLNRFIPTFEKVTGVVMVAVGVFLVVPAGSRILTGAAGDGVEVVAIAADGGETSVNLEEKSHHPRLVEFHAKGCPVCERMKPSIEQLREDCVGKRVDVLTVDLSDPRNAKAAAAYGIRAVPTIQLFDEKGARAAQFLGEHELGDLRAAAASLIATTCAGVENGTPLPEGEGRPGCDAPKAAAPGDLRPAEEPTQCSQ